MSKHYAPKSAPTILLVSSRTVSLNFDEDDCCRMKHKSPHSEQQQETPDALTPSPKSPSSYYYFNQIKTIVGNIMKERDSRSIFLFLILNTSFTIVEFIVGYITNSMGLMSDAGHMLCDNGALMIGLVASYVAKWNADAVFTYGYGRFETLAGFINSLLLVFITLNILKEALERIFHPPVIESVQLLLITASVGFFVNIIGLVFFHDFAHGGCDHRHATAGHEHSHDGCGHEHAESDHSDEFSSTPTRRERRKIDHSCSLESIPEMDHSSGHSEEAGHCGHDHHGHDHHGHGHHHGNDSMYAMYLHILADTLGSISVIISSLLIQYEQWYFTDPVCSILISILIIASAIPILKRTAAQLLQRVPPEVESSIAKQLHEIEELPQVTQIKQSNFWTHSRDLFVGTIHLVVPSVCDEQALLIHITKAFSAVGIQHMTVQIDKSRRGKSISVDV